MSISWAVDAYLLHKWQNFDGAGATAGREFLIEPARGVDANGTGSMGLKLGRDIWTVFGEREV